MLASLKRFRMLLFALMAALTAPSAFAQQTQAGIGISVDITNEQGNIHLRTTNSTGKIIIDGKSLDELFEEFFAKKFSNLSAACMLGCINETADNSSADLCPAGTYLSATATATSDCVCLPCPIGGWYITAIMSHQPTNLPPHSRHVPIVV